MVAPSPFITEPEHPGERARADVAQGFRAETGGWDEEGAVEETCEREGIFEGDALVVEATVGEVGEVGGGEVGAEGGETCVGFVEGVEGNVDLV